MSNIKLFTAKNNETESTVELSGGKGHNLIQMKRNGFNVPSGLIIPTSVCNQYRTLTAPNTKAYFMDNLVDEVMQALGEHVWPESPHKLISIRSGAPVSMPGMMDTLLNVGAGYEDADLPADLQADCRRRFVEMYADVVMNHEGKIEDPAKWLKAIITIIPSLSDIIKNSIEAVFKSWDNERAAYYRRMNNIPEDMGTAVVLQSMVFGNMNESSGSGVLFTRNPSNGNKVIMGEFLINCQGEDVVAGTSTPMPLDQMKTWNGNIYNELLNTAAKLEEKAKDMQDIEFTIQDGELFILQTRNGKRTPRAEVQIALDLLEEGKIVGLGERIKAGTFSKLREPTLPESFNMAHSVTGIPAGGYFATGKAAYSQAEVLVTNEPTILVTEETTPNDIKGMAKAQGILTLKGGATSHAAVVARGMNKPCVVGVGGIVTQLIGKGEAYVLISGQTGQVWFSDKPFDLDLESKIPMELLADLFALVLKKKDWVEVKNMQEAENMRHFITRVCIPVAGLGYSDIIRLSEVFDKVVLLNPERSDRLSTFIGTPEMPAMSAARKIDAWLANEGPSNVLFDSGAWVTSTAAKPFKTMKDVLDPQFIGYLTNEFLDTVLGGPEVIVELDKTLKLKDRVLLKIDPLEALEIRVKIG